MAKNTTQTKVATSEAVTVHHDFHPVGDGSEKLFSVRAGIPLSDAFNELSVLVSSSIASIDLIACECEQDTDGIPRALWNSIHLLNFSYALIQSIHGGHHDHAKGQS